MVANVSFDTHSDSFRRYNNNPSPSHYQGGGEGAGDGKGARGSTEEG